MSEVGGPIDWARELDRWALDGPVRSGWWATFDGVGVGGSFARLGEVYRSSRRGYPPELIGHLEHLGVAGPRSRVLDIGAGTGQLTLALAASVESVVALEPEPDMVRVGEHATAHYANVQWGRGRDVDVGPLFGTDAFDLAVIGNAFHHLQGPQLLVDLDDVVSERGAVMVCSTSTPVWLQRSDWSVALRRALEDQLGRSVDASGVPDHREDAAVLGRSSFAAVRWWIDERSELRSLDSVIGEVVSSASGAIDERRAAALRRTLETYATGDAVNEQVVATALIASRHP